MGDQLKRLTITVSGHGVATSMNVYAVNTAKEVATAIMQTHPDEWVYFGLKPEGTHDSNDNFCVRSSALIMIVDGHHIKES